MAMRPWITPDDVFDYSDRQSVKTRDEGKIRIDISRAEDYIIHYTRCDFSDPLAFPDVPDSVRTAALLIAETYAAEAAGLGAGLGTFKSESFDDYSYTAADMAFKLSSLGLGPLLDAFIMPAAKNTVTLRMRKL